MPLLPNGSLLVFSSTASTATVSVSGDVERSSVVIPLDRKEFSNAYLLTLQESDGGEPILVKNIVGNQIQFNYNCGSATSIRDTTPDDANVNSILKALVIRRWTVKGGPSSPTQVENLWNIATDHVGRIKSFDGYQALFSQKLSWQAMKLLQNENFSWLTTTGLDVSGEALTQSNILIRDLKIGVTHVNPQNGLIVASRVYHG